MAVVLCVLALMPSDAARGAQEVSKVRAAESHIRQKNYAKAIEILEPFVQTHPRFDAEVYVMLAVSRVNLGEKEKAVAACERGLEVFPNSRRLEEFYVSLLQTVANRAEIKERLEARLTQNPQSRVLMKSLGQILLDENPLNPRAEQLLMTAAAKSPQDAEAHYLYGQWACLNNKESLCLDALRKALALSPTNDLARMQIHTLMGIAEDKAGRHELAEAAFRNALKLN
ncbi:MAG TPA: tetratricopeptide repeat protein, partial [Pyrinomonadaceae bacterium]|nr:tetratricopeptide repeat protein [Pyrinomonadaceae bacterium]